MKRPISLYRDTRGAGTVEYALILVAILLLGAGAWKLLGANTQKSVQCAGSALGTGGGACGGGSGTGTSGSGDPGTGSSTPGLPGGSSVEGGGNGGNNPQALASTGGPSFSDQVRGQDAKQIDGDLANLAADVYNKPGGEAPPGWARVDPAYLDSVGIDPSSLSDDKFFGGSGFRAAIYTDGKGNYVLSYAGTDPLSPADWANNLKQGLGYDATQYNQAIALAKDAKAAFGDNLVITGHSLGGGLASAAALATGSPAVTFNAAGLSDDTIKKLDLDPAAARQWAESGQIRRYAVEGEILTNIQEKNPLTRGKAPDAIGTKIDLPDPNPLGWKQYIPGAKTAHGIKNHLNGAIHDAWHQKYPQW
ncbi:Mbeg1-like protein [Pendulispora albinea]|uniref:DUF2974 domain-containing protein n=1 Tax=Pendulispora albinea TaxID=2741071 RepID=A0ABZ2LMU7_9BACT